MKRILIFCFAIIAILEAQVRTTITETDEQQSQNVKTYSVPFSNPSDNHYDKCYNGEYSPHICLVPAVHKINFHTVNERDPLLMALHLSKVLGIHMNVVGFNNYEHLPINPYVALLLSHYGKYVPIYGKGRGLYGYVASNNYHNNKPFGAYKIYEDNDS